MTEEEKNDTKVKVIEKTEEEEEIEEEIQENIKKILELLKELDKFGKDKKPDIRICPKCFSVRIKRKDVLSSMGITTSYPVYFCMDCGWTSNKWLYLDHSLTREEQEEMLLDLVEEIMEE
jgi:molecular chaperone DnaK (HSP70)